MTDAAVLIPGGGRFKTLHERIDDDRENALPDGSRWDELVTYRKYFRGKQRSTLTLDQRRMLHGVLGHDHSDNIIKKAVTEPATRVELTGWEVDDETALVYLMEDLWIKSRLPSFSADAILATLRDGNHAVGIRWSPTFERVILSRERWWDGKSGMFVAYGEDQEPVYAVKEWTATDAAGPVKRRTVYWDDRIERYIERDGAWVQFQLPEDETWPVPWRKRDGTPLHIPIVHLASVSDDDTKYGASLMAGGLLGLQDEINDVHRDITMAARMTAYQMYWATGVAERLDEAGEPIKTLVGPGMFLENDNENAHYGVLPSGDMSQLIASHGVKLNTVSRNSSVPLHLITGGDWPSGEALLRADLPLSSLGDRLVESVKPAWATIAHRAVEIRNTFAPDNIPEDPVIVATFAPTSKPDEMTLMQMDHEKINTLIALQTLGFSQEYLMERYGLTPAEIAKVKAQKLVEQKASAEADLLIGE